MKDEGPGIPADQLERLLAAPNEPDDAWTPRRGMGLSICRTLAERMGGRLWADAREGRGSTFHFTAHVAVAPGPAAPHLRAHQPLLDRRKVWILGGSPATQQLLINQTRFWGMVPRATGHDARGGALAGRRTAGRRVGGSGQSRRRPRRSIAWRRCR